MLLSNGGADNAVHVVTDAGSRLYELAPWEHVTVSLPTEDGAVRFTVESESGFRPSELDPNSTDRRELGVLLGAPRIPRQRDLGL